MEKLFVSCPMRGRTEEQIRNSMDQMHKIAEAIFDEKFEVIDTWIADNAPACNREQLWYLGKSIEMLSQADAFIGVYDDKKEFDGCIVENYTAKLYGIPQYLVNLAYVAPDVIERRLIDQRVDNLEIY